MKYEINILKYAVPYLKLKLKFLVCKVRPQAVSVRGKISAAAHVGTGNKKVPPRVDRGPPVGFWIKIAFKSCLTLPAGLNRTTEVGQKNLFF